MTDEFYVNACVTLENEKQVILTIPFQAETNLTCSEVEEAVEAIINHRLEDYTVNVYYFD